MKPARCWWSVVLAITLQSTVVGATVPTQSIVIRVNGIARASHTLSALGLSETDLVRLGSILPNGSDCFELLRDVEQFSVGSTQESALIAVFSVANRDLSAIALAVEDAEGCISLLDAEVQEGICRIRRQGRWYYLSSLESKWLVVSDSPDFVLSSMQRIESSGASTNESHNTVPGCRFWITARDLFYFLGAGRNALYFAGGDGVDLVGTATVVEEVATIQFALNLSDAAATSMHLQDSGMEAIALLADLPAINLGMAAGFSDWRAAAKCIRCYSDYVRRDNRELYKLVGIDPPAMSPLPAVDQLKLPYGQSHVGWNWESTEGFYLSRLWATDHRTQVASDVVEWDQGLLRLMLPTCGGALPRFVDSPQLSVENGVGHWSLRIDEDETVVLPGNEAMGIDLLDAHGVSRLTRWDRGATESVTGLNSGELVDSERAARLLHHLSGTFVGVVLADPIMWWNDYSLATAPAFSNWRDNQAEMHLDEAVLSVITQNVLALDPVAVGIRPVVDGVLRVEIVLPRESARLLIQESLGK